MSDSLWTHGLQHAILPYPSLSPRVCPSSCPLNQWCFTTISSSAALLSWSFPASGSFLMTQLLTSGGQSTEVSASASVLPMNIQGWFSLGLTGLTSLLSKGLSRIFSSTTVQKHQLFTLRLLYGLTVTSVHDYWEDNSFNYTHTLLAKWCLCFLISCLGLHSFPSKKQVSYNFMAAVTLHSDFRAQRRENRSLLHLFPLLFAIKWWDRMPWS